MELAHHQHHPAGGGPADPWLPAGATETRGNHVDAYTDINSPDGFGGADFRATTTAAGLFDRVYDPTRSPLASNAQQMAAITSLFYTMNWLHDDWYDAGFTEAAGNGQTSNYGRGGVEGDALLAEDQDDANGGSRNNANMSTPEDGMAPRMQVYLWTGADDRRLTLQPSDTTPATRAPTAYGPRAYDLTATVVAAQDGTGASADDGCEPLTTSVTGQIALVNRGNCSGELKAANAQAAGAVAVIIAHNTAGSPAPGLPDDANVTTPITIPVMSIGNVDGVALRTALAGGPVTATMHRALAPEIDGAVDKLFLNMWVEVRGPRGRLPHRGRQSRCERVQGPAQQVGQRHRQQVDGGGLASIDQPAQLLRCLAEHDGGIAGQPGQRVQHGNRHDGNAVRPHAASLAQDRGSRPPPREWRRTPPASGIRPSP